MDVLSYLKHTKNIIVGNSSAKVSLKNATDSDGPVLQSILKFIRVDDMKAEEVSSSSGRNVQADQCRVEAANIITSVAHGPKEAVLGLLQADAPRILLECLSRSGCVEIKSVRIAVVRALRAVYVAAADCTGPALWGLGDDCKDFRAELRATLDLMFQSEALDVILPLLEDPVGTVKLYIAQLLAFAVRIPRHGAAITDWLPKDERLKEIKGKRGWENEALVDANSPKRQGGWAIRRLTSILDTKDAAMQEAALYAIATLVKENKTVAQVLEQPMPQKPSQTVLEMAADHSKDRKPEVRLAACLCVTNIVRTQPLPHSSRRLPNTTTHILTAIIQNDQESYINRMKACYVLSSLVADDPERCIDAWNSGSLQKIADLFKSITPEGRPQEWDDGEPLIISQLRESTLCAIAALSMHDENIRNDVGGKLSLLPSITISLQHPYPGVRYGACQCVRALSRSVRVLRTTLLDSGVGMRMCDIVDDQEEDKRVTNIALASLCNLLTNFSPLRKPMLDRGMVARIAALSRYPEEALQISALCAIKNIVDKATRDEKKSVMAQLGWNYFLECLTSPNLDIQEQAMSIMVNIASAEEDIEILLGQIQTDLLMPLLERALEAPHEGLVDEAIHAIGNISNGPTECRDALFNESKIIPMLRALLTHSSATVRKSALESVEHFSRMFPDEMKAAGFDETLRQIVRENSGLNVRDSYLGTRGRPTTVRLMSSALTQTTGGAGGDDIYSELRDLAQRTLTNMEDRY